MIGRSINLTQRLRLRPGRGWRSAVVASAVVMAPAGAGGAELAAFPGAVGQGAAAVGGRGGDVYHVTTRDDYHPRRDETIPGSLRHAINSAEGPRTIVFDVGGTIALKAPLPIERDKLTIAGQTAPGPGVTLWGYPVEIDDAADVVVRYLRIRLGDFHAREYPGSKRQTFPGNKDLDAGSANALDIGQSRRVIVDHVSTSWGMDETLSVTRSRDVTVQHCIIAASLNDSFHPKGPHGFGTLIRGVLTPEDQQQNAGGYSFVGNLWAHHRARNPSVGGEQHLAPGKSEDERRRCDVNLVNNVVFDWGDGATHRSELGQVRINLVGNYYVCGPAKGSRTVFRGDPKAPTQLFHSGNCLDDDQNAKHDGSLLAGAAAVRSFDRLEDKDRLVDGEGGSPFGFYGDLAISAVAAPAAYRRVVVGAGCSLVRDAVDRRLIAELRRRQGTLLDSQEELRGADGLLAGIDDVEPARRPAGFDTDGDGMPDEFERRCGLDLRDPADGAKRTLSSEGYTNLEVYLHELVDRSTGGANLSVRHSD
ncbi:MAG: hypothetical protein KF847_04450 [Pirellulales bacterium]|nr:hypothetical protein [Pirellulales bacterium]